MKRYGLLLSVFAAAAWLLVSAGDAERLWHYRNLGKAYYEDPTKKTEAVGRVQEGARPVAHVVPRALELRPGPHEGRRRSRHAIVELQKAQKQDPAIPHTWFNLGIAFKKERRYEEAVVQFDPDDQARTR